MESQMSYLRILNLTDLRYFQDVRILKIIVQISTSLMVMEYWFIVENC